MTELFPQSGEHNVSFKVFYVVQWFLGVCLEFDFDGFVVVHKQSIFILGFFPLCFMLLSWLLLLPAMLSCQFPTFECFCDQYKIKSHDEIWWSTCHVSWMTLKHSGFIS